MVVNGSLMVVDWRPRVRQEARRKKVVLSWRIGLLGCLWRWCSGRVFEHRCHSFLWVRCVSLMHEIIQTGLYPSCLALYEVYSYVFHSRYF